jgi:prophage maintenance system killer protein
MTKRELRELVAEAALVMEHYWNDANARVALVAKLRKALEDKT